MTFEYTVQKSADVIFNQLAPSNSVGFQSASADGARNFPFKVNGRIRIFFIPYDIAYVCQVEPFQGSTRISMKAKLFRLVEIKRVYQLKATRTGTHIRENVILKGNRFLSRVLRERVSPLHPGSFSI